MFEGVSAAYADTLHQRHLAQVGFADRLVGDLIARLREVGAYDKALVIITADHGASYREGRSRRRPQPQRQNLSDILQVPILVKLPDIEAQSSAHEIQPRSLEDCASIAKSKHASRREEMRDSGIHRVFVLFVSSC